MDNTRLCEQRKETLHALQECSSEENLWNCIVAYQDYPFYTSTGLPFRYTLKIGRNGEYTKEPVKTKFGYHIILKVDEKEKEKLKDVKEDIKTKLTAKKMEDDNSIYYKSLIKYRESKKLTWKDDDLKKQYNAYMDKLIENSKKSS